MRNYMPVFVLRGIFVVCCIMLAVAAGCKQPDSIEVTLTVEGDGIIMDMTEGLQVESTATMKTTSGSEHLMSAGCSAENDFEGWYLNDSFLGSDPLQTVLFNSNNDRLVARFVIKMPENDMEDCIEWKNSTPLVIHITDAGGFKYQCEITGCGGAGCESDECDLCTGDGVCLTGCEEIPDDCYLEAYYYRINNGVNSQHIYSCINGDDLMVLK